MEVSGELEEGHEEEDKAVILGWGAGLVWELLAVAIVEVPDGWDGLNSLLVFIFEVVVWSGGIVFGFSTRFVIAEKERAFK